MKHVESSFPPPLEASEPLKLHVPSDLGAEVLVTASETEVEAPESFPLSEPPGAGLPVARVSAVPGHRQQRATTADAEAMNPLRPDTAKDLLGEMDL